MERPPVYIAGYVSATPLALETARRWQELDEELREAMLKDYESLCNPQDEETV